MEHRAASGLYILYGSEVYLLDFVIQFLKEKYLENMPELNYTEMSLPETGLVPIIEACETLPVFSAQRIVLIHDCDFTKDGMGKYKEIYDGLFDYIDRLPEGLLMVLISPYESIFKGRFVKKVDASDGLVSFKKLEPGELSGFITKRVQRTGKKITQGAVQLISRRSLYLVPEAKKNLYDLDHLITALTSGDENIISEEQVEQMLPAPFTETIFQLMDTISKKRSQEALRIFYSVRRSGTDVFGVFYMIVRQVRNLIRVKAFLENPKGESGAKYLSLSPFEYGKLATSTRSFTYRELYRMMRLLYDTESQLKESPADPDTLLTVLIVRLCGE